MYLYIPSFTVLCPVFLPACHTTGFAWVPLYDYTTLHICRLVQCITVSYWASVGTVLCAPRFLLCISLYASFFVTCSVSCTFCVYVICAPSHLAPRIPFLYTVVRHTLSVCHSSFPLYVSVGLADGRILSLLWPAVRYDLVRSLSRPCLRRTFFTRLSIGR